jgi:hypothetical protein
MRARKQTPLLTLRFHNEGVGAERVLGRNNAWRFLVVSAKPVSVVEQNFFEALNYTRRILTRRASCVFNSALDRRREHVTICAYPRHRGDPLILGGLSDSVWCPLPHNSTPDQQDEYCSDNSAD